MDVLLSTANSKSIVLFSYAIVINKHLSIAVSSNNPADIHIHLSALVKKIFDELEVAQCISSSNSKGFYFLST